MVENKKKDTDTSDPGAEEGAAPYPKMDLCQRIHRLALDGALQEQVFNEITTDLENPSLYRHLKTQVGGQAILSDTDLSNMENKLEEELVELEKKVDEAKESAGDMEVMDARVAVARFAAKSLSEERALESYQKVLDLPKLSSGKKIDALMESARLASFYSSTTKADEFIEKADKLANEGGGGDWDRRNRLKVYKGLQRLLHRDMQGASSLLLDCIATFSCTEICTYTEFIVYIIMSNILHLPRPELKKKIIDGPEIVSVSKEIPAVVRVVI